MEAEAIYLIFGAFGFSLILSNFILFRKVLRPALSLEKKGYKVSGTLVRVDRVRKQKSVAYYAVVKYRTLTGRNIEGRSVLSIRKYLKDSDVPMEIIYNPDKEEEFMPVEFFRPVIYKRMILFLNLLTLGMLVFVLFQIGLIKL